MPLYKFTTLAKDIYSVIWYINETKSALLRQLDPILLDQASYSKLKHPRRCLEWIAARLALQNLCKALNYPYYGLAKDSGGKPYLLHSPIDISLAHSFPFAVAAISQHTPIGIDIQFIHGKLQALTSKYLNAQEVKNSHYDLEELAIYWCAKEAVYKSYGGKGLSLKQDITIKPFNKCQQGTVQGIVKMHQLTIHYSFISDHVLAWCQGKSI